MAVQGGRRTVSSPASVSNASMRVKGLLHVYAGLVDELSELGYLANFFEGEDLIFLVTVDC